MIVDQNVLEKTKELQEEVKQLKKSNAELKKKLDKSEEIVGNLRKQYLKELITLREAKT